MHPRPAPVVFIWLVVGLLVTLAPTPLLRGLRTVYWHAFAATDRTATKSAQSGRSVIDVIRQIRNLAKENETLKSTNLKLQAEVDRLQEVDHENSILRGELGFVQANKTAFTFTPATIIGRSPATSLQTVTIDQGSRDGVAVDQGVTSQGFFIGRIIDVTDHTASVQLITSGRSKVPIILSQSRATGLLLGGLAGLIGDQLPNDIQVVPGEGVVTSNLGNTIPAGLPVGTVQKVISAPSAFVTQVSIISPIAFSKLETVLVVKSK